MTLNFGPDFVFKAPVDCSPMSEAPDLTSWRVASAEIRESKILASKTARMRNDKILAPDTHLMI